MEIAEGRKKEIVLSYNHDPEVLDSMDRDERPAPGMLTSDQHSTIVGYAGDNSQDASKVSWEVVRADGGLDKWLKPKKDSKPRVYTILKTRSERQMEACAAEDEEE